MPKKAINSLLKKKKKQRKSVINGVYIFSYFYRPTVFPLTRKNYRYSKLTSSLFPLFFLAKERKKYPHKPICAGEPSSQTSHLTWLIFVLHVFLHGAKGTASPRLPPPAQPFPAPAPTFQGRAVGTRNWERPGCTWQCLGAEGGCRIPTPWRGLTLVRPRRAGCRAEPAPRCCPASHAAFILVL